MTGSSHLLRIGNNYSEKHTKSRNTLCGETFEPFNAKAGDIRGLSKKYPTLGREKKVLYLGGYNT
jgi:hypothetical protein